MSCCRQNYLDEGQLPGGIQSFVMSQSIPFPSPLNHHPLTQILTKTADLDGTVFLLQTRYY